MSDATSALGARVLGGIYDTPYTLYIATSSPGGDPADQNSSAPALSADGLHIAFGSAATDLTDNPPTRFLQIYVRNLASGALECKSLSPQGATADGNCFHPDLSADGDSVVFHGEAPNLVPGATRQLNVFLRRADRTVLVSQTPDDRAGGGLSSYATISADGRRVAFQSEAADLVAGDSNEECDIFVRDMERQTTQRISLSSQGEQANGRCAVPVICGDGRFVVYQSAATNLVENDTNGAEDVFVRDLRRGLTTRVSVASDGRQANGPSQDADISADGRYVVFSSRATNLDAAVKTSNQVYRHDRDSGQTRCVSLTPRGTEPNGNSYLPSISANGRFVAFGSFATNLADGDTDAQTFDLFLHDCQTGATARLNDDARRKPLAGAVWNRPTICGDGRRIAYCSTVPRGWRAVQVCLAEQTVLEHLLQPKPSPTVERGRGQLRIGGVAVPVRNQPDVAREEKPAVD